MQNTMVRGGEEMVRWGKNKKLGVKGKKMKKGKEKRRKITLKKGEEAFKMHLFWL